MEEEKQEESTVEVKAEEAVPVEEDAAEAADEEKEDPETVKLREELAAVKGQLLRLEHERYLLSRGCRRRTWTITPSRSSTARVPGMTSKGLRGTISRRIRCAGPR